jgi:hypothetical protein
MALTVYQLKVVLRDVKPAVWRRVLVAHDATVRTLHETVQVVMGWANCHLHRFIIHGKEYGVAYEGGISFADNPDSRTFASNLTKGSNTCMISATTGSMTFV